MPPVRDARQRILSENPSLTPDFLLRKHRQPFILVLKELPVSVVKHGQVGRVESVHCACCAVVSIHESVCARAEDWTFEDYYRGDNV